MIISPEKYVLLSECLIEIGTICHINQISKSFYCGTRLKWGTPNCLLVIMETDSNNPLFEDTNTVRGCCGSAYLTNKPEFAGGPWAQNNKWKTFHYKVITQHIYDQCKGDWNLLADDSWLYPGNSQWIPGVEVDWQLANKYLKMKAFW